MLTLGGGIGVTPGAQHPCSRRAGAVCRAGAVSQPGTAPARGHKPQGRPVVGAGGGALEQQLSPCPPGWLGVLQAEPQPPAPCSLLTLSRGSLGGLGAPGAQQSLAGGEPGSAWWGPLLPPPLTPSPRGALRPSQTASAGPVPTLLSLPPPHPACLAGETKPPATPPLQPGKGKPSGMSSEPIVPETMQDNGRQERGAQAPPTASCNPSLGLPGHPDQDSHTQSPGLPTGAAGDSQPNKAPHTPSPAPHPWEFLVGAH